jgi:DNA-binding response OmpR family regulator
MGLNSSPWNPTYSPNFPTYKFRHSFPWLTHGTSVWNLAILHESFQVFDSSNARLLLVQAEPLLVELTSFRLELLGYQLGVARTGEQAILSIQSEMPDLVIVDSALPDGDGIEWINRIRGDYRADELPVIVFSLDPSLETVERAFHAGAQDYLIVPFDPAVMEEKIVDILTLSMATTRR